MTRGYERAVATRRSRPKVGLHEHAADHPVRYREHDHRERLPVARDHDGGLTVQLVLRDGEAVCAPWTRRGDECGHLLSPDHGSGKVPHAAVRSARGPCVGDEDDVFGEDALEDCDVTARRCCDERTQEALVLVARHGQRPLLDLDVFTGALEELPARGSDFSSNVAISA